MHFAIHIVWRANVICTYRKSGIARKTTVAYPELRLIVAICKSNAQQWVWDEISKEDEGGPFSGIFGTLLLFGIIWLLGKVFGGKDKNSDSSHHINDEDRYCNDKYVDDDCFD